MDQHHPTEGGCIKKQHYRSRPALDAALESPNKDSTTNGVRIMILSLMAGGLRYFSATKRTTLEELPSSSSILPLCQRKDDSSRGPKQAMQIILKNNRLLLCQVILVCLLLTFGRAVHHHHKRAQPHNVRQNLNRLQSRRRLMMQPNSNEIDKGDNGNRTLIMPSSLSSFRSPTLSNEMGQTVSTTTMTTITTTMKQTLQTHHRVGTNKHRPVLFDDGTLQVTSSSQVCDYLANARKRHTEVKRLRLDLGGCQQGNSDDVVSTLYSYWETMLLANAYQVPLQPSCRDGEDSKEGTDAPSRETAGSTAWMPAWWQTESVTQEQPALLTDQDDESGATTRTTTATSGEDAASWFSLDLRPLTTEQQIVGKMPMDLQGRRYKVTDICVRSNTGKDETDDSDKQRNNINKSNDGGNEEDADDQLVVRTDLLYLLSESIRDTLPRLVPSSPTPAISDVVLHMGASAGQVLSTKVYAEQIRKVIRQQKEQDHEMGISPGYSNTGWAGSGQDYQVSKASDPLRSISVVLSQNQSQGALRSCPFDHNFEAGADNSGGVASCGDGGGGVDESAAKQYAQLKKKAHQIVEELTEEFDDAVTVELHQDQDASVLLSRMMKARVGAICVDSYDPVCAIGVVASGGIGSIQSPVGTERTAKTTDTNPAAAVAWAVKAVDYTLDLRLFGEELR